jgi:hypothetical protein
MNLYSLISNYETIVINKFNIRTYLLTLFLVASAVFLWWLINYIRILLSFSNISSNSRIW